MKEKSGGREIFTKMTIFQMMENFSFRLYALGYIFVM